MKDIKNDIDDIHKDQLINKLNENDECINHININLIKEETEENIKDTNNSIILNTLFKVVEDNNLKEIESNLIKDNSNINTLNNNGLSLLHLSVIKGNVQIVNKLLKYGANPNILSVPNKQTPLHFAYLSQESTKDNIINTLLSYNADVNIMDLYDNKPSDYNNMDKKNDLNTPDKKNKIKKEDIYYKVNDININFFSTSDIKKKTSNKKQQNKKINKIKCNCIFTPKKNDDKIIENIKNQNNDNEFNNNKDIYLNQENIMNNENNNNENINNELIMNNKINDKNNYNGEITAINYKDNKESDNNLFNSKDNNEVNEVNEDSHLDDSLEEQSKNQVYKDININNDNIDELLKSIITNKRKSIAERSNIKNRIITNLNGNVNYLKNNIFININNSNNSCSSTQNQTSQKKGNIKNKEKIINDKNKNISEFKYNALIKSNIINKNIKNFDNNYIIKKINKNRIYFKQWLSSINLSFYYDNFIENEIYEIHQLINISKKETSNELFKYINTILKTKKYGHIYRIICKLEMDTYTLDSKLINFMVPSMKNNDINSKLSISGGKSVLCGRSTKSKEEKDTLKIFLNRFELNKFYQNFYHNGFDMFEYVILQMYTKIPINDFILENHFHIYENDDRIKVLDALETETQRINDFINSEEYLFNKIKYKYENFALENKKDIHLVIKDDDKRCNLCSLF